MKIINFTFVTKYLLHKISYRIQKMKKTPKELSMFFSPPPNKILCEQHHVFNNNIKILSFSRTIMLTIMNNWNNNTKNWCVHPFHSTINTNIFNQKSNNKIFAYVYNMQEQQRNCWYCTILQKVYRKVCCFFLVENVGVDVGVDVRME